MHELSDAELDAVAAGSPWVRISRSAIAFQQNTAYVGQFQYAGGNSAVQTQVSSVSQSNSNSNTANNTENFFVL